MNKLRTLDFGTLTIVERRRIVTSCDILITTIMDTEGIWYDIYQLADGYGIIVAVMCEGD